MHSVPDLDSHFVSVSSIPGLQRLTKQRIVCKRLDSSSARRLPAGGLCTMYASVRVCVGELSREHARLICPDY